MENKTCGECQWYDDQHLLCVVGGDVVPTDCACDSFIPIKPTNGDRIRLMTNEELAKWFALSLMCDACPMCDECTSKGHSYNHCREKFLDWLNAPTAK